MPEISIIVPVYNVEEYIHRCIDSILAQTFRDFELILVDDGSPDKCGEICDDYKIVDSRIKVVHKENGGLSDARNAGLEIAHGDYIGFVDSDDYIEDDMYEKLLMACKTNNSKIAMCGRINVFEEEIQTAFSFEGQEVWESKKAIENLLTWDNIDSSACDKLFHRDLFEDVKFPIGKYNEDIYIISKIIHKSGKIVHIGEAKYYYLQRSNSITTEEFSEKKLDLLDANQKVIELINQNYTELMLKAESFQLKGIIFLLGLLQNKRVRNRYLDSYKLIRRKLSNNILRILINPYIGRKAKAKAVLMYLDFYYLFKKMSTFLLYK